MGTECAAPGNLWVRTMGVLKVVLSKSRGSEESNLSVGDDIIYSLGKIKMKSKLFWMYVMVRAVKVSFGMWSFLWSNHMGRSRGK